MCEKVTVVPAPPAVKAFVTKQLPQRGSHFGRDPSCGAPQELQYVPRGKRDSDSIRIKRDSDSTVRIKRDSDSESDSDSDSKRRVKRDSDSDSSNEFPTEGVQKGFGFGFEFRLKRIKRDSDSD